MLFCRKKAGHLDQPMTAFAPQRMSSISLSTGNANCTQSPGGLEGAAHRMSDHPYISIHEGQSSQRRQNGNLTYENVIDAGEYANISDVEQDAKLAQKHSLDDAKQETEGYSYVNTAGKPNLQIEGNSDQQYMYANTPSTAAMLPGNTNDVTRGNDVMGGGNDIIMEDNDVYEGGTMMTEERSVYALAKETDDVNGEYDADSEGIIIEENNAYEGAR